MARSVRNDRSRGSEPDGHALATFDGDAGTEPSGELLGAYGDVHVATGPSPWDRDGLHGAEGPRGTGVIHHGARHMLARGDGLWLQPEPLLYLGMTNGDPGRPRAYSGVYAGGNPVMWEDRSGRFPLAVAPAAGGLVIGAGPAVVIGAGVPAVACAMSNSCSQGVQHGLGVIGGWLSAGANWLTSSGESTDADAQAGALGGGDAESAPGAKPGPVPNRGVAKPHGGSDHDQAIDDKIGELNNDPDVDGVRKNQVQVDVNGNRVGNNRPDVQYDKNGCHHCIEYDTNPANGARHAEQIKNNDPNAKVETHTVGK